ncbi:uncharacterized protein LOC118442516 [Vespa mandarinia]|uniref:uncharacterized protein LOC118442516 n=1 Tax=Vespa mandarinia TaxID=7446 RepID=UPI001618E020|nr:uncharacterized protein LOC118442516 [Vespa mandarinia]
MDSAGISVKVFQDNKNIYENYSEYSNVNDLNDVICNIRNIQGKINDFLTQLLQENTSTDKKNHMAVSDTDSNSTDEDVEVGPKKCKLISVFYLSDYFLTYCIVRITSGNECMQIIPNRSV